MEPIFKQFLGKELDSPCNYASPLNKTIHRQLARLEEKIGDDFSKIFTKKVFAEKYYLLKPNQLANKFWYLVEGNAIMFNIVKGEEVISHFFYKNDFITFHPSARCNIPSTSYFRIESRAVVYEAKWADIHCLQKSFNELYDLEIKLIDLFMLDLMNFVSLLQLPTTQERVDCLQKEKPLLFVDFKPCQIHPHIRMDYKSLYLALK